VGRCPGITLKVIVGTRSVRVGEALGNNRYLVYENEQVLVRKDSTQNITATLAQKAGEEAPALAFALGAKPLARIPPTDDFEIAAFSPDATLVAIGVETNSVRLYNVADGKALRRLGEAGEYWVSFVTALSFSADGRLLASNGWLTDKYIGEINIWDVQSGRLRRTIPRVKKVSALALSPDGQLLAAGVEPNTIKLWRVEDGKLLWDITPPGGGNDEINSLSFSPDGQMLIAGHSGGDKIYVYHALTAKHQRTLPGALVSLARDGRVITYSSHNYVVTRNTWRSLRGELIESKQVKNYPDERGIGEQVIVKGDELWNSRSEQLLLKLPGNYAVAFSSDGRRVLVHADGGYVIWSLPAIPGEAPD
jgi:WD40 repeat protein